MTLKISFKWEQETAAPCLPMPKSSPPTTSCPMSFWQISAMFMSQRTTMSLSRRTTMSLSRRMTKSLSQRQGARPNRRPGAIPTDDDDDYFDYVPVPLLTLPFVSPGIILAFPLQNHAREFPVCPCECAIGYYYPPRQPLSLCGTRV